MPENFDTIIDVIDRSRAAAAVIGAPVSGTSRRSLPSSIAKIPRMPDLVNGGTYYKADGTPIVITPISGETTAIRLLVASTGPRKTALVLTFTGTVTIDWGDGTTSNPTSNTAIAHTFDGVNPIPCGRPYGVYLITITGGTVTAIASSNSRTLWRSSVGNIVSAALKSMALTTMNTLFRAADGLVNNPLVEKVYIEAPVTSFVQMLYDQRSLSELIINNATLCDYTNFVQATTSEVFSLDLRNARISSTFHASLYLLNCTSLLFNSANTEISSIDITTNSLQKTGLNAMIASLPSIPAVKNIVLGSSAAVMELTTAEIAVATAKNWNVIRG